MYVFDIEMRDIRLPEPIRLVQVAVEKCIEFAKIPFFRFVFFLAPDAFDGHPQCIRQECFGIFRGNVRLPDFVHGQLIFRLESFYDNFGY